MNPTWLVTMAVIAQSQNEAERRLGNMLAAGADASITLVVGHGEVPGLVTGALMHQTYAEVEAELRSEESPLEDPR